MDVQAELQKLWDACTSLGNYPAVLVVDRETGEMMERISASEAWLRRLNSPAGLKQLFPALRGKDQAS